MIVFADTVADPWAVMIHTLDADTTDFTVVCPYRLNSVAFETITDSSQQLDFIANLLRFVQVACSLGRFAHFPLQTLLVFCSCLNSLQIQVIVVLLYECRTSTTDGEPGGVTIDL